LPASRDAVVHWFETAHGEVLAGMAAETARDPEAAQALCGRLTAANRGRHVATIVKRAAERGEIPPVRLPA
jgi:hypothetical protein